MCLSMYMYMYMYIHVHVDGLSMYNVHGHVYRCCECTCTCVHVHLYSIITCKSCATVLHTLYVHDMFISDLLDGLRDSIGYDAALLEAYSLNVTIMDNGTSREIMFEGMASDSSYTEVC